MKFSFFQLNKTRKLENAIGFSIILFLFKLVFPYTDSFIPALFNELLVVLTFYFVTIYILEFLANKKYAPLSLILNTGILAAIILFVLLVLASVLTSILEGLTLDNFMYSIGSTFYSFIFIAALSYIFSVFRTLFFLRQKKNPKFYFNTMLFFLAITSVSSNDAFISPEADYIPQAFMVVSIILISINSIRIPWIAFLTKKEKIYLLIFSVVLTVIFSINIGLSSSGNNQLLLKFSSSLHQFLILLMIYGAIFFGIIFFTTLFHLPTASAFDRKAQEVTSLMNLSQLITQVFDFKELAETVTDITTRVCNSDSAWLVSERDGDLQLSAIKNIGYVEADKINKTLSSKYNLKDITNVKSLDFSDSDYPMQNSFKSLAIAPLKVHDQVNGYLIAARKNEDQFDDDDQKSISAFADYAAIAIENAKLLEKSIEKERLEKELDVARDVQYKILPEKTPQLDCLEISAVFIPAFEVGGDYYDFFELDNNRLGFVIADVSGKGISAAFIMAEIKGIFGSLSKLIDSPKNLLIKANEILKYSLDRKSFITAIYGIFDLTNQKITFSRSGHTPMLLVRNNNIEELKPGGIGLGLDFSHHFENYIEEIEIKLKENDILVMFTDGITESKNSELEDYGLEQFENLIRSNSELSLDQLSKKIMKEITIYSKGNPQHDDITLVIFKWKSKNQFGGDF